MSADDLPSTASDGITTLQVLVPLGADREDVLDEVVRRWVNESTSLLNPNNGSLTTDNLAIESHSATIRNTDFRDDNPNAQPIDLGNLLQRVATQLNARKQPYKTRRPIAAITLINCKFNACKGISLSIPAHFIATNCQFNCGVYFKNTVFFGLVNFVDTYFNQQAIFSNAVFYGDVDFSDSTFLRPARFDETSFNKYAIYQATDFRSHANFKKATFKGFLDFSLASFNRYADFRSATFFNSADFDQAGFNHRANFSDASFGIELKLSPSFSSKNFTLQKSRLFGTNLQSCDFRRVLISDATWRGFSPTRFTYVRKFLTDWLDWSRVRGIGRLQLLTRISYIALLAVPLVAGLWPSIQLVIHQYHTTLRGAASALESAARIAQQSGVELTPEKIEAINNSLAAVDKLVANTPYLPFSWLLVFLAALAVTLGHLVYQTLSPQLVQGQSADDLVDSANDRNRVDGEVTPERMRQAIDHLRTAAEVLPHRRSQWLVTRNRRTVWLPNDIELYKPAQITEEENVPDGSEHPDDDYQPPIVDAKDQEVSPADRKRIAIEEGEKARYDIEVFKLRPAAWLSGGCYFLGGWYLFGIIVMQLANIADAAGMTSLRQYILPYRQPVTWWGTGILLGLMAIGFLLAWDGVWERLGRIFKWKSTNNLPRSASR